MDLPPFVQTFIISKFTKFNYIFTFGRVGFSKLKLIKKVKLYSKFNKLRIYGLFSSVYFTYAQLIKNQFTSVLAFHSILLELKGIGFKYRLKHSIILLALGFSHIIKYNLPPNVHITLLSSKLIRLSSISLLTLNRIIFKLKKKKKFNVYKGKGILLKDEIYVKKEGKKSSAF